MTEDRCRSLSAELPTYRLGHFPKERRGFFVLSAMSARSERAAFQMQNMTDTGETTPKTAEISGQSQETACRQHVPTKPTGGKSVVKKRRDDAGFSQIDLFGVSANVGSPEPKSDPSPRCETCRHWHKNAPVVDRLTGKYTESTWHHCVELLVITKREYGSPLEGGTVLTKEETQTLMIANVDFLNTAPCFHCDRWEERKEEAA